MPLRPNGARSYNPGAPTRVGALRTRPAAPGHRARARPGRPGIRLPAL